jgi:hypothetical protein
VIKIEPQYQYASRFIYEMAIVAKNGSLGAIDQNNKQVVSFRYQFLQPLNTSELLFGYRTKYFGEYTMGVITRDEKVIIPAEYSYIIKRQDTYIVTTKQDSIIEKSPTGDVRSVRSFHGLLDSNGKALIPCKYEYLDWMNDSLIVLSKRVQGTNQALFNKRGEQLTGFEYMVFGKLTEGVAKARIGNKFGFIYPNGKVAIPIQFDYCEDFSNGYALIKEKDNWGAINKEGTIIIEPKLEYQEVKAILKEKFGS